MSERTCANCGVSIEGRFGKAKTCSRACGVTWQNAKRQAAHRAAWESRKQPCPHCGGEIGPDRRTGVIYCSKACKKHAMDARWRLRSPGYMRQYLYGLSPEQYAALLEAQDNRCAICQTDIPGGKGGWHVDHKHGTKDVRGLLCHNCNLMLGHANDDIARLEAAIAYLR